jgi:UDP-2-acetamido-3-amino-2,3-dideoxy-glucuronate N-acetyltransferase
VDFPHVMRGHASARIAILATRPFIETGAVLGNNVTVKNGVAVWQGVTVEDNVFLGVKLRIHE